MIILALCLIAILFSTSACVHTLPTPKPVEQTHYTLLLNSWVEDRWPQQPYKVWVEVVKPVETIHGPTEVLALQIRVIFKDDVKLYVVFVRKGKVLSWIEASMPEPAEEEEELFTNKERA